MAAGCDMPAGSEEFVRCFRQVVRRPAQAFRVTEHDDRALGQHALHRFHVVDQRRHQRFHAFHRDAVRDGGEHVFGVGNLSDQGFRAVAHRRRQLQFTAWCRPHGVQAVTVRTLVGRVEFFDGVDFVAEEFDTDRMRDGRREHVEDAATHRKLASIHDQVDARVRVLHQSGGSLVERQLLSCGEHERLDIAEPGDNRLDERAHGHHQHPDRPEHGIVGLRVGQAAEYRHAGGDRVGSW